MRILVVDDDEVIRNFLQELLVGPDRTIDLAKDCTTAFNLIRSHQYDLITLDLSLPDGCGLDVLTRLRKRGDPVKTLIVSADAYLSHHIKRARELNAFAIFTKPFECAEFRLAALGEYANATSARHLNTEDNR